MGRLSASAEDLALVLSTKALSSPSVAGFG